MHSGDLIAGFSQRRVLVLGDIVADEYLMGRPERISREAPVLILHYTDSFVRPGGATNTAYNLSSLGARTSVVGVIGDDEMGRRLRQVLDTACISTKGLIVDTGRPTTTATRVIAKGTQEAQQQIVRIDRVDGSVVNGAVRDSMITSIREIIREVDTLLISDYENGVISQEIIDETLPLARDRRLTVTVDAHGDLFRFRGITAATPNQPEAERTLNTSIRTPEELVRVGEALVEGMDARGVLITRGSEGIALFERDQSPYFSPVALSQDLQVVDPTGAGDTVAAVFTLALAGGASMREAAYFGNVAGGQVVRKWGAATLTPSGLLSAVQETRLPMPE